MRGSLSKLSKTSVTYALKIPLRSRPPRHFVSLFSARALPALSISRRWNSTDLASELNAALDEQASIDRSFAHPGALSACPGCGALAQTIEQGEPGYYSLKRKTVSSFVKQDIADEGSEEAVAASAIDRADPILLESLGLNNFRAAGKTLC